MQEMSIKSFCLKKNQAKLCLRNIKKVDICRHLKLAHAEARPKGKEFSSDPTTLKVQFNLLEAESNQLSVLAGAQQIHFCEESCSKCESPSLPSLETIFIETPSQEDSLNIETAMQFNRLFLSILKCTSEEEVKRKSSEEWLQTVFQSLQTETEVICGDILRIKSREGSFDFIIDERLKEMMSHYPNNGMAAYHYSISCGEVSTSFGCVIKRLKLIDCFTQPYNVGLLKAFNAPMKLKVVNGHDEVRRMTLKEINVELDLGGNEELNYLGKKLPEQRKPPLISCS